MKKKERIYSKLWLRKQPKAELNLVRGEPSNRNHSSRTINADSDYDLDMDDDNMSGTNSFLTNTIHF